MGDRLTPPRGGGGGTIDYSGYEPGVGVYYYGYDPRVKKFQNFVFISIMLFLKINRPRNTKNLWAEDLQNVYFLEFNLV